MIKFGSIKKEHLVGAAIGVGTVAVGYYLYKKNQSIYKYSCSRNSCGSWRKIVVFLRLSW